MKVETRDPRFPSSSSGRDHGASVEASKEKQNPPTTTIHNEPPNIAFDRPIYLPELSVPALNRYFDSNPTRWALRPLPSTWPFPQHPDFAEHPKTHS